MHDFDYAVKLQVITNYVILHKNTFRRFIITVHTCIYVLSFLY
jgi:hypothetical protein